MAKSARMPAGLPTLAQRVKLCRELQHIGLREAVRISGLSLSVWQQLECGNTTNPRLKTLQAMARTLDCTIGELVDGLPEE